LDAVPHNLPVQLTSFVGREAEIGAVAKLLHDNRMVTLTGSGGCGKTRLSLQVAAQAVDQYPDGVWFVELAPLDDAGMVPQAVASAVGVKEQQGRDLTGTIAAGIGPKSMLLVLDNCEHLVAPAAA